MTDTNLLTDYINEKDVSEQFGLKLETLRTWAARRRGPSGRVAVGRKIFYRKDAIAEWLRSRERAMQE